MHDQGHTPPDPAEIERLGTERIDHVPARLSHLLFEGRVAAELMSPVHPLEVRYGTTSDRTLHR